VIKVSNHGVRLAICNLHLLPRAVQAGLGVSGLELPESSGTKVVEEQCAWCVEMCV
jgi:hypothetical protein